ncbi:Ribose-phosphate pyrophosphokinase 2 [Camelus dromedarius]|uniref:ribose-phosphate diphosphokinase n=1 Tax=Camelus dromedarius TaxID=9838 RepID=A0A5N4DZB0_CAMDR|nr:Ribose-phosphate pyrophosphokinase 2 [Camelus dromedarius]
MPSVVLFCGSSRQGLSRKVEDRLGLELDKVVSKKFSNQEVSTETGESVRGQAFYYHSEWYSRIFHDARQDKKDKSHASVSEKRVANLLTAVGADRITTTDLQAAQSQGFFDIPVDNLHAELREYCRLEEQCCGFPFMDRLNVEFALLHPERRRAIGMDKMILAGDVQGQVDILVDVMYVAQNSVLQSSYSMLEPLVFMPF